ncbi:MAG: hypothetical protein IJW86_08245 [Clostridia bacterium]|nr:hypothetical protein [Clostridia bacterium]
MKTAKHIKSAEYTRYIFVLRYILSSFCVFIAGFMLLKFPETAGQGISDGIDLCLGTLIPSLYPFMIVSSLVVSLDTFSYIERLFSKITNTLLRLPGKSLSVIVMSMIGGFPIGGKMIKELYEKGEITEFQAKRLMLFCINPGPAFTISSVGFYMLGSKKAGVIIYFSVIAAAMLICFATRFLERDSFYMEEKAKNKSDLSFSACLVSSVSSGSAAMLGVCAWVIAFSCLNRLTDILPLSPEMRLFVCSLLEVTNGCYLASGNLGIPAIAAIIGFGGICTHFQVMSTVRAVRLKYKHFITGRIMHGALSAVICNFILNICPVSYDVFSLGTLPTKTAGAISVPVSIGMLIMCALIMLGDSFYIRIKPHIKKQA